MDTSDAPEQASNEEEEILSTEEDDLTPVLEPTEDIEEGQTVAASTTATVVLLPAMQRDSLGEQSEEAEKDVSESVTEEGELLTADMDQETEEKLTQDIFGDFEPPPGWEQDLEAAQSEFETRYQHLIQEMENEDAVRKESEDQAAMKVMEGKLDQMLQILEPNSPHVVESAIVKDEDTEGDENLVVLGPNHPKMQRFQLALKAHLERQLAQADNELRDLDASVKSKKKERIDLGNQLYNLQYELTRHHEEIDKLTKSSQHMSSKRADLDASVGALKAEVDIVKEKLVEQQELEKTLMRQVKEMDVYEWCVRKAAQEFDGELLMRQLVDEKMQKLRISAEEQKRDQDFYMDRVLTHVQQLEETNLSLQRQITAHEDEQRELNSMFNNAVTEIEALQMEKTHLQRAWNETVSVVRARDEALNAARNTLHSLQEDIKNRQSEIRALGLALSKEQESHESSALLLKRRRLEEKMLTKQAEELTQANESMESQLAMVNNVKIKVEAELLSWKAALVKMEQQVAIPRRRVELLNIEKARLEDSIFQSIQEQMTLNKVTQNLTRKVQEARDRSRRMEAEVAKVENELSSVTVLVEKVRSDYSTHKFALQEIHKKVAEQEKLLLNEMVEIKNAERKLQTKTGELDMLNRKLYKVLDQQGGIEKSKSDLELDELERQIVKYQKTSTDLQEQWLKKQDSLLRLTQQRDDLLKNIDLLRKEVFIMERKKIRIEQELQMKKVETDKVKRATEVIRSELTAANVKLNQERKSHDQLEKDNMLLENDLMNLLQDAEMEALELQEKIDVLDKDKDRVNVQLKEGHEQCLNWEKKVKLAKELKNTLKTEAEGPATVLKLAIHHMQVRHTELMRAQEKLMGDLERSVERRDRIIQQADLHLKKANVHPRKTKLNIQRNYRKLEERNRILAKEAEKAEQEIANIQHGIREVEEKIKTESETLAEVQQVIVDNDDKIGQAALQKHKNLIEIILRQQKYKILEAVKVGRYRVTRDVRDVEDEIKNFEKKCYTMLELADILGNEFPEASLHVKLIKASILPNYNYKD